MRCLHSSLMLATLLLAGCGGASDNTSAEMATDRPAATSRGGLGSPHFTDSDALIREKGKGVVQEAFSLLSSNLQAALAAGGTSNAIPFCSIQARLLTEAVSQNYAVELRRVSHRARNPMNRPDSRAVSVLAAFQNQIEAGQVPTPVVVRMDQEAFFYAPILVNNPLCLDCHGERGKDIPTDTVALLDTLYPNDHATGFKLNDLRGMWVVRINPEIADP